MPLYEFVCKDCEQKFEELKVVDDFSAKCPVCGSDQCEKIMSATSFVVNGSTNRSIDTVIGEDANRRWQQIEQNKKQRSEQYKGLSDTEIKVKEKDRQSSLLNRQQQAFNLIDKAKKDAGITKKEELGHLLKK